MDGRRFEVALRYDEPAGGGAASPAKRRQARRRAGEGRRGRGRRAPDEVVTPMQGTVLKVLVEVGQEIAAGDVVCIVEAMKMENEVAAHRRGPSRSWRSRRARA